MTGARGPIREVVRGVTVPYRVRFDECGPDGVVRTSALLRYAQDVAWIHSERMGFDRDVVRGAGSRLGRARRRARDPRAAPAGQVVELSTAVIGFRTGLGAAPDGGPPRRTGRSCSGATRTGS